MADLLEGQFELDGYLFGLTTDGVTVLSEGWNPGQYDVRSQDAENPIGDTVFFGRDYHTPGSVTFSLLVHNDVSVRATLARLAAVWRADTVRKTPGAESVLRFNQWGETRKVYGRPRMFAVEPQQVNDPTYRVVTANFKLSEQVSYSDAAEFLTMSLLTSPGGGGVTLPQVLPWTLGTSASVARRGIVTVQSLPAPFIATFHGPVTGTASSWRLQTPDWAFTSNTPLGPNETMVLDTRKGTFLKNGVSVAGSVGKSSLTNRLPVGTSEILFGAADNSVTAYVTIEWLPTDAIM